MASRWFVNTLGSEAVAGWLGYEKVSGLSGTRFEPTSTNSGFCFCGKRASPEPESSLPKKIPAPVANDRLFVQ